jgi:hypothetical protein
MEDYIIETSVPMPDKHMIGRKLKHPFTKMNVGDSFFVPLEKADLRLGAMRVRVAAGKFAIKNPGLRFAVHLNDERTGARCWRTQ